MIAELKSRWEQITTGLKDWVDAIGDSNVLISLFTYDSETYRGILCRTPVEFLRALNRGIEANGGSAISLDAPLSNYGGIIKDSIGRGKAKEDWLQYAILVTTEDSQSPDKGIADLQSFIKEYKGEFNFTIISQATKSYRLNKLANSLNGNHYSVRIGSNISKVFVEALTKEKQSRS